MNKALVLSFGLILVFGFAAFAQGELTGSWDTTITINPLGHVPSTGVGPAPGTPPDPTAGDFFSFDSTLEITYAVGGWSFTSTTGVDYTGWWWQDFAIAGSFGAFDVSGGMIVSPLGDDALFPEHIFVDTGFTFGAVEINLDFDLYGNDVRLGLGASATTGLVDITGIVYFGDLPFDKYGNPLDSAAGYPYAYPWPGPGAYGDNNICDLDFAGAKITVDFPFCCADVSATLVLSCDGFESICFGVDGIVVANIPWFALDADLCFTLETKTLKLTPVFDFGADICFDVYIESSAASYYYAPTPLPIPSISVVGLGLECEIGGVSFSGVSYWGDPYYAPDVLYGTDYWEAYTIATTEDACCGPFDFDITIFFKEGGDYLFDIDAFEANFSYELGENFIFSMGLEYEAGVPGLTLWSIGFEITW